MRATELLSGAHALLAQHLRFQQALPASAAVPNRDIAVHLLQAGSHALRTNPPAGYWVSYTPLACDQGGGHTPDALTMPMKSNEM